MSHVDNNINKPNGKYGSDYTKDKEAIMSLVKTTVIFYSSFISIYQIKSMISLERKSIKRRFKLVPKFYIRSDGSILMLKRHNYLIRLSLNLKLTYCRSHG